VLLAGAALLAAGCGGDQGQRFIPSEEVAQRALETALKAWQGGKPPPGRVQEAAPTIQLVDTHHKPGQRLAGFVVLGPTPGDAHRCYAVRLTFEGPREEVRARYVIMGQDPLWVMRYEDYEMVSHWDHPMPEKPPTPKTPQG
jgi:hypothetical protein